MVERHHIVFLERDSIRAVFPRPRFPHTWTEYASTESSEVVARLEGATVAIVNKARLTAEALAALPALELIAVAATGVNTVDVSACHARGVAVSNVPGYARHTVPEHVFAIALALRRNLFAYRDEVSAGRWSTSKTFCLLAHPVGDLRGATMGIIGLGAIGHGTKRLAEAFGMEVLVAERKGADRPRAGRVTFEDVLLRSDVLSLHCPLTAETRGLIGVAELARMKRGAILINTARGSLVDESALAEALSAGRIGGAGLDVLGEEPPVSGASPLLQISSSNFILTPHVAWASAEAMQALANEVILNIEAFAAGQPTNVVPGP